MSLGILTMVPGLAWKGVRLVLRLIGLKPGGKGGGRGTIMVLLLIAAVVFLWQRWTIAGLETDVQAQARRADAAERNVREYARAIAERNAEIEDQRAAASAREARGQAEAGKVLDEQADRSRQRRRAGGATTPEELNQWLEWRLSR